MTAYTPIESEFASSDDAAAHDAWVRQKVLRAIESTSPSIPHDEVIAAIRRSLNGRSGDAAGLAL